MEDREQDPGGPEVNRVSAGGRTELPPSEAGSRQGPAELLTADEREAVRQAGLLYTFIAEHVVADGPTRDDDLAELCAVIHVIQRTVLAQAAARVYPKEFRLLGGVVVAGSPQGPRK